MKHSQILPLLLLMQLLLIGACKDKEEQLPAYLRIEPFTVNAQGGADWQKITDGWLYVNNEFLGGYSLPATVPILAEGEVDILIFPGVKENGIANTPSVYPFMERFEGKVTLTPTQTSSIQPTTRYDANAVFPWSEDRASFNVGTIILENRDSDTATSFIITPTGAFEGRSVYLKVDTAHIIMEIATEQVENLPATAEKPVWLELHYRNDVPFELWVLGTDNTNSNELAQPVYQFLPSENWNKIYFNLTDFLINLQQQKYRLFYRVSLPRNAQGIYEQNTGEVFLDNMRLIHF